MQILKFTMELIMQGLSTIRPFFAGTLLSLLATSGFADDQKAQTNALILQADFSGLVMAGVAYTVNKELDIYNLRPLIPLYDIKAASASLAYNAQTWPAGTVFVSVVDPGVGTKRKSVVLETKNGLYFVSPDNGSLSGPAEDYGISAVREIDESVNRRANTDWAHTFHGRDVYSYTGARLAAGVISFKEVGPLLPAQVIQLDALTGNYQDGLFSAYVSGGTGRLGNIEFSITRSLFETANAGFGDVFEVVIRNHNTIVWQDRLPYVRSFGEVPLGENLLFINSSGWLSIAVNQGNFADKYAIGSGKNWTIELRNTTQKNAHFEFESIDTFVSSRGVKVPVTLVQPKVNEGVALPLIVMAHGHGGTRHEAGGFTRVAEGLAKRGIASIRMDFPGCGDSTESFANNNLGNMLKDIKASRDFALNQVLINTTRIGLFGFSMGGRLALLSSADNYQVLATWAPAGSNGAAALITSFGGPTAYGALKSRSEKEGFAPFTTKWGQDQKLGAQWFTDIEESMPLDALVSFTGPVLVLHGDSDTVVTAKVSDAVVAAASSSEEVIHHVIAGAGHGLGLFTNNRQHSGEAVDTTVQFISGRL